MSSEESNARAGRILSAAASLIAHYGYDKTTVSDIAEAAGVSKGAVYLHWPSKEALFDALIALEMQLVTADTVQRIQADPRGGTLGSMYRHALLALQAHPLMSALYTRDARILGETVHRQDVSRYTQRLLFGQDFVCQLQAAGLLRPELDPGAVAYWMAVIAYGFMGIASIIPAGESPPVELAVETLVELIERGLASPGGNDRAGKQALAAMAERVIRQVPPAAG